MCVDALLLQKGRRVLRIGLVEFPHHTTLESFKSSAREECQICGLAWNTLNEEDILALQNFMSESSSSTTAESSDFLDCLPLKGNTVTTLQLWTPTGTYSKDFYLELLVATSPVHHVHVPYWLERQPG